MLVRIIHALDDIEELTLQATCLKEVLSLLPKDTLEELREDKLHFVLTDSSEVLRPVELNPDIADTPFHGYDTLHLVRDVEGEGGAIIGAIIAAVAGAGAVAAPGLAGIGWAIGAMAINMAISLAVGAIIQALIPTQEFEGDASASQNSPSLYNNSPLVREQGGSVPLICGEPYCGGVLISSALSTAEAAIRVALPEEVAERVAAEGLEWFVIPVTFAPVTDIDLSHFGLPNSRGGYYDDEDNWEEVVPILYTGVEGTITYWDGETEVIRGVVDSAELYNLRYLTAAIDIVLNRFPVKLGVGVHQDSGYYTERLANSVSRDSVDGGLNWTVDVLYKKKEDVV